MVGPRGRRTHPVDQHDVDQAGSDVVMERRDVVRDAESVSFALLLGHVAHEHLDRPAGADGLRDAVDRDG